MPAGSLPVPATAPTKRLSNIRFMAIVSAPAGRGALELQGFDAAYLERLHSGHLETEQHFAAYFGELILIKLRSRGGAFHLIEDVRQETLLRVLRAVRSPEGLRDPRCLGSFVNSVCNNVLLEQWRAQGRERNSAVEPDSTPDAQAPDPDPEAQLVSEERKELVRRVIDDLPPRDRDLLRALFLEEREKDEVCEQFGVERDYLRVLLHRAKTQFRELYLVRQQPRARVTAFFRGRRPSRRSAGW